MDDQGTGSSKSFETMIAPTRQGGTMREFSLQAFVHGLTYTETQSATWRHWTSGNVLFTVLQREIRDNQPGLDGLIEGALQRAEDYRVNLEKPAQQIVGQKVIASLFAASKACQLPASLRPLRQSAGIEEFKKSLELDKCCQALGGKGVRAWGDVGWMWVCVLSLLDAPVRGAPVHVPVAAWDQNENSGFLNTLVLEVLEVGAEQDGGQPLGHHPRDLFILDPQEDFSESMRDAWLAARKQVAAPSKRTSRKVEINSQSTSPPEPLLRCTGRWSIVSGWTGSAGAAAPSEPQVAREANGRSASAAAARGWWLGLTKKVPDNRVIAIGQIDREGTITAVDKHAIGPKVQAIMKAGCFDTIAVVRENDNYALAEQTVQKAEREGRIAVGLIRVVDLGVVPATDTQVVGEDRKREALV